MFFGCNSLEYLNINNFETKNVTKMAKMFLGCKSLTSLNLSKFYITENTDYQNMFFEGAENIIYCVNDDFYEKIKTQMEEKECAIRNNNCFPDWKFLSKKIIYDTGKCIENCNMTEKYKYEYNNKCYNSCPKGTTSLYNKNYLCESFDEFKLLNNEKTDKENNNENSNNDYDYFYKFCEPIDFLKDECAQKNYDSMISLIKNDINKGVLNDLLDDVINKKIDIFKEEKNIKYQITSSFNQKNKIYDNISTINLETCEDKLKYEYNISDNDTLIIFKYDYTLDELLIPIVGYEIFHPRTYQILDLNLCKNIKINIIMPPINITEEELYKHNPKDNYYKDKCNSYSNDKGVDMTLFDRKKEYNDKNLALCGDNCEFEEFYNLTQKVKCLCEPQYNSSLITLDKIINKQKLLHNFLDIDTTTNLGVIKCYKNFLSFKGLKSNIGSYIIITIILVYFIGAFIIAFIEYKILCNKIDNMLKQIQEKSKPNIILNNNINKNPLKINKDKYNKKE